MTNNIIIIMGVSGCGKSTISKLLAESLNYAIVEGDEFHSRQNIEKIAAGKPLTDDDRRDWLLNLNYQLISHINLNKSVVLTCSALKQIYRDILTNIHSSHQVDILFVHLHGPYDVIYNRIVARKSESQSNYDDISTGVFFPPSLLQSQFDALEVPDSTRIDVYSDRMVSVRSMNVPASYYPSKIVELVINELNFPSKADFGIYGMGTMGKALARNFARYSCTMALFNRHVPGKEEQVAINHIKSYNHEFLNKAKGFEDVELFVSSIQRPRRIFLLIDAGKVIDLVIQQLKPLLSSGDVIVDLGNSHFQDTLRRVDELRLSNIEFVGCGISGGEYGALHGPAIMISGNKLCCDQMITPLLSQLCAKDAFGQPCCGYVGNHGTGHYVKMIHNGIEYAEMQLLAEVYSLYLSCGKTPREIAMILDHWKQKDSDIDSYLLSITSIILQTEDNMINDDHSDASRYLINKILDNAKSKGTGNWATVELTKESIPATMISSSLYARFISSYKSIRVELSKLYNNESSKSLMDDDILYLRQSYQLSRIVNHIQGFWLLIEVSNRYQWNLQLDQLAQIWSNGCIIRSRLMQQFVQIFRDINHDQLTGLTLLTLPIVLTSVSQYRIHLAQIVSKAIVSGLSLPCMTEAINFVNGMSTESSTSNLIQAQRDYFGAHTFQRIDRPENESYHYTWKSVEEI